MSVWGVRRGDDERGRGGGRRGSRWGRMGRSKKMERWNSKICKAGNVKKVEEQEGQRWREEAQAMVAMAMAVLLVAQWWVPAKRLKFRRYVRSSPAIILAILPFIPVANPAIIEDHISAGFTSSPMGYVDTGGVFLASAGNVFALGFMGQTSVFLSIIHIPSQQVVWTANREAPITPFDQFLFSVDGNLSLVSQTSSVIWSANVSSGSRLQLQDSGNLVLFNSSNQTLWQSFDHPSDTLLSGQILLPDMQLTSNSSPTNFSSGPYSLLLQSGDLHLVFDSSTPQPYWSMSQDPRIVYSSTGAPSYAILTFTGLSLVRKDSTTLSEFTWNSNNSLCRASLEPDGNLRIYVYSSNIWTQQFQALTSGCNLPLFCGHYGVCTYEQCSCPNGFQPLNDRNITQGCKGPSSPPCTNSSSPALVRYQNIGAGLDYFANPFTLPLKTSGLGACQDLCTQNCSCSSFFFYNESGFCFLLAQLASIQSSSNYGHSLYVKTSGLVEPTPQFASSQGASGVPTFVLPIIIAGSIFIIVAMIGSFLYWYLKVHKGTLVGEDNAEDETFLDAIPGLPTRFSFKELQIATNNFSMKLGSGGFGSVYEGVLPDKTKVAVKQLESIGQGKKEFRAEVAIIGSIHHVHLVQLRGFCAEGVHRLLVYEFMSNGSLDKCLFVDDGEKSKLPDWKTRYNMALGTARGLAYLHDDCREKIIHCDIKPENILLDENYNAKVSDFGLAKLLNKEQSQVFTTMRGTRGYLAPEWLMNLAVSEKSDVYSFGMVLLEIISGRKNCDPSQTSEKRYFPAYAFQQAELGKLEQLVDVKLKGSPYESQFVQTVKIALWCIQEDTSTRPSMGKVVQMLEGNVKVQEPPLSSQLAVRLHARMIEEMHSSTEPSTSASDHNSQDFLSAVRLSAPR